MRRREVVIVSFPYEWICYSQMVLGLCRSIADRGYQVSVVYIRIAGSQWPAPSEEMGISFSEAQINRLAWRIISQVSLIRDIYLSVALFFKVERLKSNASKVVLSLGVDNAGFLSVARDQFARKVFVSHELDKDLLLLLCKLLGVENLITQSFSRREYLFTHKKAPKTWIVPNSSDFSASGTLLSKKCPGTSIRLIYVGNIIKEHSIEAMIQATECTANASLHLHGPCSEQYLDCIWSRYGSLRQSNRLSVSTEYLDTPELTRLLHDFDVGFCLYDLRRCEYDFNYESCPSGKLHLYANCGMPVIGSDILGLRDIASRGLGRLVKENKPSEICEAIHEIINNYDGYSHAAKIFANENSFYVASNRWLDDMEL